ncbi:AI-2E family transporter [Marinibactrum halimedae]|uniref:Membrane protein n=1 Tax=Marinibactrum halimedae TaxID=1444977 RepID=A0AA37WQC5_9GAMM|nr:AI-2E family transporter [Marinibactrum halimedae]MCD9460543.1 AI-2E family transporter [Marinibactrum halimedae]GLS27906.1 membrane protein [Marinibactrum halimedae]
MTVELSPISRFLLVTAAFVVVVAGMKTAESLLVPFFLSLFIAVICSPPLSWMNRKGVPNWLAILIIIAVIVVSGMVIGAVVGSSISSFRESLPEYQERLHEFSASGFAFLSQFGINIDPQHWRENFNPSAALAFAGNTLASLGNVMTNAFLILLTVVFILAEEVRFSDKYRAASLDADSTLKAVERFTSAVNRYMAIKTGMSFLTGFTVLIWLWIQGVDYPALWGLLAFLLNFVPTLGSILAAIPAVLLSLVQLGPGDALITAVGFVLVNGIVGNGIEPRVMGKGLDLSALVVFLSLVFWGWILGPVGMLLSVPLTMTVKIALESFEDTRWLGIMLGSGKGIDAIHSIIAEHTSSNRHAQITKHEEVE